MKTHPVVVMIGGGILAAWISFWAFVSALSTLDFMKTSGGHPGIGTFFLPPGLADGATVLGIGMMVYAFIVISRTKQTKAKPIDPAVESELARLNRYERLAFDQLIQTGGMTGEQFADRLHEWGLPMANRAQHSEMQKVFDVINQKTTLLARDPSGTWQVRHHHKVKFISE